LMLSQLPDNRISLKPETKPAVTCWCWVIGVAIAGLTYLKRWLGSVTVMKFVRVNPNCSRSFCCYRCYDAFCILHPLNQVCHWDSTWKRPLYSGDWKWRLPGPSFQLQPEAAASSEHDGP
jgi:hypothetical protein